MRYAAAFGVLMACWFSFSSTASAQFYFDPDDADNSPTILSVTTTTTGLVAAVVVLTIVAVTNREKKVEAYLRNNQDEVHRALNLGAGDAAEDLAWLFGVEDISAFGTLLRANRKALRNFADPETIRADSFIETIEKARREI